MINRAITIYCILYLFTTLGCGRMPLSDEDINTSQKILSKNITNTNDNQSHGLFCGTKSDVPNQDFEKKLSTFSLQALQSNPYCIRIVFYIVRKTDGSGGFNIANISQIMRNLNDVYNPRNIFLYNTGVEYIDNSIYYDLDVSNGNNEFPGLISSNNSTDAINFYLVNNVHSMSGQYAGMAENIPSRNLVVANSMALEPTSAHEVGHCLNLFHTHRSSSEGGCPEAIDGSNCSSCGDYVCDTPADPGLGSHNLSSCIYTGAGGYNPLVNNIMSYAGYCRNSFTNGQGTRLLAALAGSSILQPIINDNCNIPSISGPNTLCNSTNFTLNNVPANTTVLWDTSPSGLVTLTNHTTNSITVEQNPGQVGNVTLRARISHPDGNRINITKTVALPTADVPQLTLNPSSMQCLSMGSTRYFYAGYTTPGGTYQNIENDPNVAEIDWQVLDYSTSSPTPITNFQKYSNGVTNSYISLFLPYKSSDYIITIVPRAKHECGAWGEWGPGHAYFIKRNCASPVNAFDVTYDVSTQSYILSFSELYQKVRRAISNNTLMQSKISNSYDIRIYNNDYKDVYSSRSSNEIKINVPKLPSGKYTIELLQDGFMYKQYLNVK